jgi:hypothetical protein
VLVAALAVIAVLKGALQPNLPWRTASLIVAAGLLPTLLWRRTRPLLMDVIAFVVAAVMPMFMGGSLGFVRHGVPPDLALRVVPLGVWTRGCCIRWNPPIHLVTMSQ